MIRLWKETIYNKQYKQIAQKTNPLLNAKLYLTLDLIIFQRLFHVEALANCIVLLKIVTRENRFTWV